MSRGGAREGAGKKRGVPHRITAEIQQEAAKLIKQVSAESKAEGKELPHMYLLRISQNKSLPLEIRMQAAQQAAPYFAPKLAAIEQKIETRENIKWVISDKPLTPQEWVDTYGDKGDMGSTAETESSN